MANALKRSFDSVRIQLKASAEGGSSGTAGDDTDANADDNTGGNADDNAADDTGANADDETGGGTGSGTDDETGGGTGSGTDDETGGGTACTPTDLVAISNITIINTETNQETNVTEISNTIIGNRYPPGTTKTLKSVDTIGLGDDSTLRLEVDIKGNTQDAIDNASFAIGLVTHSENNTETFDDILTVSNTGINITIQTEDLYGDNRNFVSEDIRTYAVEIRTSSTAGSTLSATVTDEDCNCKFPGNLCDKEAIRVTNTKYVSGVGVAPYIRSDSPITISAIRIWADAIDDGTTEGFAVSGTDPPETETPPKRGVIVRERRRPDPEVSSRIYEGLSLTDVQKHEINQAFSMPVFVEEDDKKVEISYGDYLEGYMTPMIGILDNSGKRSSGGKTTLVGKLNVFLAVASASPFTITDEAISIQRANLQQAANIVFAKLFGFEGFPDAVEVNFFDLAKSNNVAYSGQMFPGEFTFKTEQDLANKTEACYFGNHADCSLQRTDGLKNHHHLLVMTPDADTSLPMDHTVIYSTIYTNTTLTDYMKIIFAMVGAPFLCDRPELFDVVTMENASFLKASCGKIVTSQGQPYLPLTDMDHAFLRQIWLLQKQE